MMKSDFMDQYMPHQAFPQFRQTPDYSRPYP